MPSNKTSTPINISSPDFGGQEKLEFIDIQDWVVHGWGEATKTTLDDLEWDGDVIMGGGLDLSPDNSKVVGGRVFLQGELLKSPKEIRANKLWEKVDKELKISYSIEDAATLTFSSGTLVGDFVDCKDMSWQVVEKRHGELSELEPADYIARQIEEFCIRPYLIPLSAERVKLRIMIYPVSKDRLQTDYPLSEKASFPGLELTTLELPLFPLTKQQSGKEWGCPLIPMILLGAEGEDQPNLPSNREMSSSIAAIMRTVVVPDVKRDSKSLARAWKDIRESGPSRLKERLPELIWPLPPPPTEASQSGEILHLLGQE